MSFKHWTLQDLTSTSAVLAYFAVLIVGLGISRLAFDGPQRDPLERDAALLLSECFVPTEIPINTTVTVARVPPPQKKANGKTIDLPEKPVSAKELTVITTGALTLEFPESDLPGAEGPLDLTGKPLVLSKAQGNFELRLDPAAGAALVKRAGAEFLLQTVDPVRFGPAEGATYEMASKASGMVTKVGNARKVVVPAGTTLGKLSIGAGQALSTLHPLSVRHWVSDATPTLMPVRVSGQPGLADVSIEVNQSGMSFDAQGVAMRACAFREYKYGPHAGGNSGWVRAGVSQTQPGPLGSAKVMLALPGSVLPAAQEYYAPLRVALASSDGRYIALGGFNAIGRFYAALGATALTGLLLGMLMYVRGQRLKKGEEESPRWFSGLFVGPDNDPSLSLLQVFIWTVITVWGFIYVFIVAGNLLTLTTEMMGLLGIAGAGSVLARWIAVGSGGSTSQVAAPAATPAASPPAPLGSDFWRMLSTNGNFDLLKLQLFVFTVVIAMYVIWRIADAGAFPVLDANTLLLMGVSQGVYISGKLAATSALSRAQTLKLDLDLRTSDKQTLEKEKAKLEEAKRSLDEQVAALQGAPVTGALKSSLEANKAEMDKNANQLKVTDEKIAALQIDYGKAIAALGLKA